MDTPPKSFVAAPMGEILAYVQAEIERGAGRIAFVVADATRGGGAYAGEPEARSGVRHRPYRVWVELAGRLGWRLAELSGQTGGRLMVVLERLPAEEMPRLADPREKYGTRSSFARLDKAEEPTFVLDFVDAIERAAVPSRARVLVLGCNRGDEIALLQRHAPGLVASGSVVGVDHCVSAVAQARRRFPAGNHAFLCEDVAELDLLDIGRFDLVIAIDVLQSPQIDDRALLRHLVKERLTPQGSLVLAFPNCRYRDGELLPGARMKNFRQPELGLLFKSVAFYRRYLQQHRRRVFVTGTHEILVTAVPVRIN
ncbi:MAG: class I SAM-dependent methyltransferase [Myxococcales bacterium FL481]|nr:MAG: class I SAM-dependent methyltransferase [Myxococcales bacterium FL481]